MELDEIYREALILLNRINLFKNDEYQKLKRLELLDKTTETIRMFHMGIVRIKQLSHYLDEERYKDE
jgi:hypothetical protein